MNMYGTMLPVSGEAVLRKGLEGFLYKHREKKVVVVSRLPKKKTLEDLEKVGLLNDARVIGSENMKKFFTSAMIPGKYLGTMDDMAKYVGECVSSDGNRKPEMYTMVPDFRGLAYNSGIALKDSVLISDNWFDIDDGMSERVGRVFEVPRFESAESDSFSFDKVEFYSAKAIGSGVLREMGFIYGVKLK